MGENRALFGICTEAVTSGVIGAVVLNAGFLHHVGPYRLHVDIARSLAAVGCPTLRLDQSGKGESPPRLGLSSQQSLKQDIVDATEELRRRGVDKVILIGLCSGADDAIEAAVQCEDVVGLVLLDAYAPRTFMYFVHHYWTRLSRPGGVHRALQRMRKVFTRSGAPVVALADPIEIRDWDNDQAMIERYRQLLGRGSTILAVFTGGVTEYYSFSGQLVSALGGKSKCGALEEVYYPAAEHTFTVAAHREQLVSQITQWVRELMMQHACTGPVLLGAHCHKSE
jgi:pimeloyl-ACP methyl ester carboxylesterase